MLTVYITSSVCRCDFIHRPETGARMTLRGTVARNARGNAHTESQLEIFVLRDTDVFV